MKYIVNGIILITWLFITCGLALTIIGLMAFVFTDEYGNSEWFKLGKQILNNLS